LLVPAQTAILQVEIRISLTVRLSLPGVAIQPPTIMALLEVRQTLVLGPPNIPAVKVQTETVITTGVVGAVPRPEQMRTEPMLPSHQVQLHQPEAGMGVTAGGLVHQARAVPEQHQAGAGVVHTEVAEAVVRILVARGLRVKL
jgi:hypothetical protein